MSTGTDGLKDIASPEHRPAVVVLLAAAGLVVVLVLTVRQANSYIADVAAAEVRPVAARVTTLETAQSKSEVATAKQNDKIDKIFERLGEIQGDVKAIRASKGKP